MSDDCKQMWISACATTSRRKLKRQGRGVVALGRVLVWLLLAWGPSALALDPSLDINQYAHTTWTFGNGLLNGRVNAFAQTPDGYLWLGTSYGLVRFDGVRAVPLALPSGLQLPSNAVGTLLAARDGTLWIGTRDGLVSWKNGKLTEYPALALSTVATLLQDRGGTVWAGAFMGPTGKLCAIRSETTTCYGDDGSLGAGVVSLYEDSDGSLWVGATNGLWRWNPGPPIRYLATPIQGRQTLAQGDHGSGLIVAADSVRQIAGTRVMNYPLDGVPSPLTATSLLRDRKGGLWIGTTAHGLVHSYQGKTSLFTHNDGLSSDQVSALFEDREGTIWVATSDGLDRFRELPVTSLSVKKGLSSGIATSVLAARDGSIWIGTADGLNRWNHGRTTIYRRRSNPGLPDDAIQSLFEDERGRIWVSGSRGLAAFENGRFTAEPSVPAGLTHAISSDNHGGLWLSLWVTANDYGLAHLVDGRIVEQMSWQSVGGGPSSGLVPDPDGGIWTGLISGGIAHFRGGQIQKLRLSNHAPRAPRVRNLSRDRDGAIWAATDDGLSRITNGRVATLTTANGLPCDAVHWIIEDDLSSYWLYTQCGLVRIARTELDAWTSDPKRMIHPTTFDSADGIRLPHLMRFRAFRPQVTKSSDGKIWFVNGDTASFIDPSHIGINTLPPPVHIEQITADRETYDASQGLSLPPLVRDLQIDYTALSFVAPEKVRFRYKLEGYDDDWHEAGNRRQAFYTNLPPRNYRFRVMACNNSGVWNEEGALLDFSIDPAYYQTNWFRVLCVAAFLALLWAAYRLRVQQLQQQERKFREAIETMPAMAFITLPDGSRTFVNQRWVDYTGLSVEQASGSGWQAVVHPDDLDRVRDKWRASLEPGEPLEYEIRFRRAADGEYRWFLTRAVPLRDKSGKIVKWYGVTTDIEDRKRAEQERERLRQLEDGLKHTNRLSMLGELTASLAHEINQPITAAVTSAGACLRWLNRDQPDVQRAREAVMRIENDGKRAAEIITHLKSFYKKDASPQRELVAVNEVVGEMLVMLRSEADRCSVVMRTELAAELPSVQADRVQLQQVLMNLMLNGIEAMAETGGELTIRTQREDGQVLLSVSDKGVGIPAEKLEQIFDPFFTTKAEGTGMGLSICRSIIEAHGGWLWATDNDGRGATFHCALPAEARQDAAFG